MLMLVLGSQTSRLAFFLLELMSKSAQVPTQQSGSQRFMCLQRRRACSGAIGCGAAAVLLRGAFAIEAHAQSEPPTDPGVASPPRRACVLARLAAPSSGL